ncbi:MAG: hypothetical protein KDA61_09240 [Planctomycetales bacterium]|nr:hypothetical protein [Planctomycetales bacterium]
MALDARYGPHWQTIKIADHFCLVYDPPERAQQPFAYIYLHDYGPVDDDPVDAPVKTIIEQRQAPTVVPLAPELWWTDRLYAPWSERYDAEQYVVRHVTCWLDAQWDRRSPQVGLWGAGMGGQGALRISYRHPNQFPVVAAISPLIEFQKAHEAGSIPLRAMYRDAEQARQDTATLHIHPLNWPRNQWFGCAADDYFAFDGVDRLRMKLYSLGVPHECLADDYYASNESAATTLAKEAWEFMQRRLQAEQRRL